VRIRGVDEWCGKGREVGKRKRKWIRRASVRYVDAKLDRSDSDSSLLGVCIDRDCKVMREGEWGGREVEMACPV